MTEKELEAQRRPGQLAVRLTELDKAMQKKNWLVKQSTYPETGLCHFSSSLCNTIS